MKLWRSRCARSKNSYNFSYSVFNVLLSQQATSGYIRCLDDCTITVIKHITNQLINPLPFRLSFLYFLISYLGLIRLSVSYHTTLSSAVQIAIVSSLQQITSFVYFDIQSLATLSFETHFSNQPKCLSQPTTLSLSA